MKKMICVAIVLSFVLSLAACSGKAPQPKIEPDAGLAAQCLESMINAETVENMKEYMTEDSQSRAQEMFDYYNVKDTTVQAEYKCHCNGYDVFSYVVENADGEKLEDGVAMFVREENGYKLCVNADAQAKLIETLKCHTCSGSGTIVTGNPTACSACGGVGTQYIPNAYFDTALNMWMGQTIACAGCGGSGQIGVGGTVACGTCGGIGLLFG